MSLINRMLQDLDARQAAPDVRHPLPADVRPLPPRPASRRPLILAALAVLALAVALAGYQRGQSSSPAAPSVAPPPVAAVSPPAVVAVAEPAPPAAAEPPVEPPPAATPVETKRPTPDQRASASIAASAEKKPAAKTVKAPDVDGDAKPARPSAAAEKPSASSSKASDTAPPVHAKGAKSPTIERAESSGSTGSPRERAEAEYRQAIGALNQGRIDDAIDGLRKALRDDPPHIGARQLLVRLLLEAKRAEDAAQVLQDGLQGQPAQLGWAMTLARLQVDRGDLAGAWQTLEFSLPAAGHSADYQGFAGHVLQRLGRFREAAVHYLNAARLAPGDGRWWLGLGLALEADGRTGEAREAFLRAKQSGNLGSALGALVEQKLH